MNSESKQIKTETKTQHTTTNSVTTFAEAASLELEPHTLTNSQPQTKSHMYVCFKKVKKKFGPAEFPVA